ncbi:flagellin [Phaeobacter sp. CAU 1743]|uniref:flagellin N-terminal helical domain-containing protein n=1 Tax=Phaeobacter sp. CAU 1743 TaxID=3140367 RepID=UPI0023B58B1E
MTSINSNTGAATALHLLGGTTQQLEAVQDDVATGKEVNTAKDNAALWAISQIMDSDVSGLQATSKALSLGEATVAVASAGAEQISDVVQEMRELALTASSGLVDYSKIEAQLAQKTEQVNSIISASQFNGVNLLATDVDGNGATGLSLPAGPDLSLLEVESADFEGSAQFDINNRTQITDQASAQAALSEFTGFLRFAVEGAAALGAAASGISGQNETVRDIADATKKGIGALVDANIEESAARLVALDVQKQLGTTSLSIANYSPQSIGVLF